MRSRAVLRGDVAIAFVLVVIGLLLSPGPAVLLIGAAVVLVVVALGWGIGLLRERRRSSRSGRSGRSSRSSRSVRRARGQRRVSERRR